jgi:DNA polymerase-3 subunit beta
MKFICKSLDILEAVNTVQKAVSTKTTHPLLDGILIECDDVIKLTGNNLEIGIEYLIKASILEKGSIIVNSKIFGDIVRKLPEGDVCIQLDNDKIIIDCLKSHFELNAIVAEGFPKIPFIEKQSTINIKEKDLKEMIRGTIFAIGVDDNRKNLKGSLIENNDNNLIMVSIDGFRMAIKKLNLGSSVFDISVIVPGTTLSEVLKILQSDDRDVQIYNSENLIVFELADCKIVSRLIEAQFLNYKNVIPDFHDTKIKLKTREFLLSIERASLMYSEERKLPIKFCITEDSLIITSSLSVGKVREEVDVEVIGNGLNIGFNPKYLIDALRSIEDEYIEINFTSAVGPATIIPIEGDNFSYMILPVKISDEN